MNLFIFDSLSSFFCKLKKSKKKDPETFPDSVKILCHNQELKKYLGLNFNEVLPEIKTKYPDYTIYDIGPGFTPTCDYDPTRIQIVYNEENIILYAKVG